MHKHKTTSICYGRTKANLKENSFCFVHKHKTTSICYGRTKANLKENSFCFVVVNLTGKCILCYFACAYVGSDDQALDSSIS